MRGKGRSRKKEIPNKHYAQIKSFLCFCYSNTKVVQIAYIQRGKGGRKNCRLCTRKKRREHKIYNYQNVHQKTTKKLSTLVVFLELQTFTIFSEGCWLLKQVKKKASSLSFINFYIYW